MNKLINTLLLLVRRWVYISLAAFDRVLNRKNKIVILAYHSIAQDNWRFSVDPAVFKKQMLYLERQYTFITLEDVKAYVQGKKTIDKPSVVITIDDGYKDVLGLQTFFAQHGIRPTLFVLSDSKHANWKELGSKREFLTTKEIRSLMKAGFEIGCHSATHGNLSVIASTFDKLSVNSAKQSYTRSPRLRQLADPRDDVNKNLAEEIIGSKQHLEKELGVSIPYFSYPRGKYNYEVLGLVKKANYRLAVTMDDGLITSKTDRLLIPRVGIDRTHTFEEFKTSLSPSVVWLRRLIKQTVLGNYL